jgi:hypothetical protein
MRIYLRSVLFVLVVTAIFTAETVHSNGRTPPKPADVAPIKAVCEERTGETVHEIFRARISSDSGSVQTLVFLIGNATEEIAISRVDTIELPLPQVTPDGYMKATLTRRDIPESKKSAMVQVMSGPAKLFLSGFKSDGTPARVELPRCKVIKFSSAPRQPADSEGPPVEKK